MENRKEFILYLDNISMVLLGILLLAIPLMFTPITTDAFILPKQIILGGVTLITLVLWGVKSLIVGSVRIKRTPFDLPIILFVISVFLSSIFSVNRFESLMSFIPLLFAVLAFFVIVNSVRERNHLTFLSTALVGGGVLASLVSIFSFFKIYLLPFVGTHSQSFTTFGSLLDQTIYLAVIFPITLHFLFKVINEKKISNITNNLFSIASIVILIGLFVSVYQLFTTQKSFILPIETGFQTAFAAISQDTGRIGQGFLFGSGFGTYATDFTRFKQIAFNQNQSLWSLIFVRSSSFVLEVLATVGIVGFLSLLFIVLQVVKEIRGAKNKKENSLLLSAVLVLLAVFLLPLAFTTQTLIFVVLALVAASSENVFEVEFQLVALRKGLITEAPVEDSTQRKDKSKILPSILLFLIAVVVGFVGFWSVRYALSDLSFQESLIAASANNGSQTYQKQTNAITLFPYRDSYYRIFSQTNLALANSLASQTPKGSSPSAQTQQTITTLIQQSLNSARSATTLSPLSTVNWQNLSSIYRSLIGFGQNAESFAIRTAQQAALLDPNNPQEYIALGGIYYQLQQWDNAQNQFQIATNLKPDFANAYYNIAHALEQKGDFQNAIKQLEIVKTLVANNADSLKQLTSEIDALQKRVGTNPEVSSSAKTPLGINTPPKTLPPQNPPVKIPSPEVSTGSSK